MAEKLDFTFDLSRVDVDDILDILELAGKERSEYAPADMAKMIKTMRACLVRGDAKITGDMVPDLLREFALAAAGGAPDAKN